MIGLRSRSLTSGSRRAVSIVATGLVVILGLVSVLLTRGWAEHALLAPVVVRLAGSYAARRRTRAPVYDRLLQRTGT